jgi:hypothetical protein
VDEDGFRSAAGPVRSQEEDEGVRRQDEAAFCQQLLDVTVPGPLAFIVFLGSIGVEREENGCG